MCDICGDGPEVLCCLLCDDEFPDLSRLTAHVDAVHPEDKPERWPDGHVVFYEEEVPEW